MEIPVKKKRGRKPKIKSPEEQTEIKVPKKRGRKPKNINKPEEVKVPKKRGRKPKKVVKEEVNLNEEPLILHIPLKNINKNIPTPFKFDNNFEEVNNLENNKIIDKGILDIPKKDFSNLCNNYDLNIIDKDKIHPIFYQYCPNNKSKKWPAQINIACLWCSHDFEGMPFGIPMKKINNEYHMFGCFCSPECATAYVFDDNSNEKWDRYSLINYLYGENKQIKSAPPKLALKKFGGYLSIEEFRKNNKNYSKNFNLYLPPMISIIPHLEESNIKDIPYENKNDNNIMDTYELKLKRSKPLPDSLNTLDTCMKLKYV